MAKFCDYEEISEWNANKSANRLDIYALKVEKYHAPINFASVKIKYTHYISSTYFFSLATVILFCFMM
jgi:hypothetical protein